MLDEVDARYKCYECFRMTCIEKYGERWNAILHALSGRQGYSFPFQWIQGRASSRSAGTILFWALGASLGGL